MFLYYLFQYPHNIRYMKPQYGPLYATKFVSYAHMFVEDSYIYEMKITFLLWFNCFYAMVASQLLLLHFLVYRVFKLLSGLSNILNFPWISHVKYLFMGWKIYFQHTWIYIECKYLMWSRFCWLLKSSPFYVGMYTCRDDMSMCVCVWVALMRFYCCTEIK